MRELSARSNNILATARAVISENSLNMSLTDCVRGWANDVSPTRTFNGVSVLRQIGMG